MKTKDFNRIYDNIIHALTGEFANEEQEKNAACVIFTRLLTASPAEKRDIIDEYDLDCCRVCSECGELMVEGWYNMGAYACSDECVIKQEGITREEFERFQIYKATIQQYLDDEGEGRKADDLTDSEISVILDDIIGDCDAYYTEWR